MPSLVCHLRACRSLADRNAFLPATFSMAKLWIADPESMPKGAPPARCSPISHCACSQAARTSVQLVPRDSCSCQGLARRLVANRRTAKRSLLGATGNNKGSQSHLSSPDDWFVPRGSKRTCPAPSVVDKCFYVPTPGHGDVSNDPTCFDPNLCTRHPLWSSFGARTIVDIAHSDQGQKALESRGEKGVLPATGIMGVVPSADGQGSKYLSMFVSDLT